MKRALRPADPGITLLRVTLAILIAIHGLYRALGEGHVAGFGGALKSWGFPFGVALAWGITLFEIGAATALLAGRLVIPASIGLALELAAGIALVHAKEGWFVVGGGRNGMEYSVLLIAGFLALVVSERARARPDS